MLLWSFTDSLAPHAALLAPSDVSKISFCPSDRHYVVAGLMSGQVLLWKLDPADLNVQKKDLGGAAAGNADDDDSNSKKLINVNYKSLSFIDESHKKPVMDIEWLPADIVVEKKGRKIVTEQVKNAPKDGPSRFFATIVRFVVIIGLDDRSTIPLAVFTLTSIIVHITSWRCNTPAPAETP